MSTTLGFEARNIQNPALGSLLLWRFCVSFEANHLNRESPRLPLVFFVLPMVFSEDILDIMASTQEASGLRMFVGKFSSSKIAKNDLVLSIQGKIASFKSLTMQSLALGIHSKLVNLQIRKGAIMPISSTPISAGLSQSVKKMMKQSEKLGNWFSQLTLHEISTTLNVRL